jgi:hypothetical protein
MDRSVRSVDQADFSPGGRRPELAKRRRPLQGHPLAGGLCKILFDCIKEGPRSGVARQIVVYDRPFHSPNRTTADPGSSIRPSYSPKCFSWQPEQLAQRSLDSPRIPWPRRTRALHDAGTHLWVRARVAAEARPRVLATMSSRHEAVLITLAFVIFLVRHRIDIVS